MPTWLRLWKFVLTLQPINASFNPHNYYSLDINNMMKSMGWTQPPSLDMHPKKDIN